MLVGLLSDIHANAPALNAVLTEAENVGVERLICSGDYIGYYYDAAAVMDRLDEWRWDGVKGNHETMLGQWIDGVGRDEIKRTYGSGIAAAAAISEATIDRLLSLPDTQTLTISGRSAFVCHGSPWEPEAYVYPDASEEVRRRFAEQPEDLIMYGHTHYPVVWEIDGRVIVNPGSVGQPRNRKPGASWALWDTEAMSVELRQAAYDAQGLIEECHARDPELPYLAEVLVRT